MQRVILYTLLLGLALTIPGCGPDHPTGTYLATCTSYEGKPYTDFIVVNVQADGLILSSFTDFYALGEPATRKLPDSLFHQPLLRKNFFGGYDTLALTLAEDELTLTTYGESSVDHFTAKRVSDLDDLRVRPAGITPFANKIFERWSDRSIWIFSADNRLQIRDYKGDRIYQFDHDQLYSVDEFNGEQYLNIHPDFDDKFRITDVTLSQIKLATVACQAPGDTLTLRFLRDTQIVSVLPPQSVLLQAPIHQPETYSTYWYETRWTMTLTADGYFTYHPSGHFSNYHLYTGRYTERDSIIYLDYVESEFGDFRPTDPDRLFRLANGHLLWPNGAAMGPPATDEHLYSERFHLLVEAGKRLLHRPPFGSVVPADGYIQATILEIHPDTLVRFAPSPYRRQAFAESLADTLTLTEVRRLVGGG